MHLQVTADICYMTNWQVCSCAWARILYTCALTGTITVLKRRCLDICHAPGSQGRDALLQLPVLFFGPLMEALPSLLGLHIVSRLFCKDVLLSPSQIARNIALAGGGAKRDFQQKCGVLGHVRQNVNQKPVCLVRAFWKFQIVYSAPQGVYYGGHGHEFDAKHVKEIMCAGLLLLW